MSGKRKPKDAEDQRPETDQEQGAPHPRHTREMIGHALAEAELAAAIKGRMHHAWLLVGPKGVGKATLAYRAARVLLGAAPKGPRPFDVAPDDPVARRVGALGHGDLFVLRRSYDGNRLKREIGVDDARRLGEFLALTPAEGGWRVGVVDAADDLSRNAANALLKGLEEPPPRTALFLVCHAPGRLLPTIRSRCRRLALKSLADEEVAAAVATGLGEPVAPAIARLAKGRPGRAIALQAVGAQAVSGALEEALQRLPKDGAAALLPLAFSREGQPAQRLALAAELLSDWIETAVRAGAGAPTASWNDADARLAQRLMPDAEARGRWAHAWEKIHALVDQAEGLNMDAVHAYTRLGTILEEALGPRP
jgi:DNA polymerase-3 subunit delta'